MPVTQFMLSDIAGTAAAFAIFALFAFVPGYALGWALNLLDFRRRGALAQAALGVSLSIATVPIVAYLAGRLAPAWAIWLVLAPFWGGFALLLAARWRRMIPRGYGLPKVLAGAWLMLGTASMIDLQWGRRLYYSVISFDYTLRVAITSAITRAGIPPPNPYFFPGRPELLRYHYFWMILCSLAQRAGGGVISARLALFGGTLWCGLALIAVLALYLRFADPEGPVRLKYRLGLAIALLGVTGLDLFPTLLLLRNGVVLADMEWWNEQVTSWVDTMLWVPHHLASLIACLTGFLLLWSAPARRRDAMAAAAVAGLCFASAVGCSVYVALTFFVFLAVWGLIGLIRKWRRDTGLLVLAGCCAAVPLLQYVRDLRGPASGGSFLVPTVRAFKIPDLILASMHAADWKISLANLLLLPLNYFLELGFFLSIGLIALKRLRAAKQPWSRWELAACAMAGSSIAVCTFLRSGVIGNNDLGYRGFLPAQFILLVWAVSLAGGPRLHRLRLRGFLAFLLLAGAAGSVYQVCLLRGFTVLSDFARVTRYPWLGEGSQIGNRTYAARQVYEQLRQTQPVTAVMQYSPSDPEFIPYGLYSDRQLGAISSDCGTVMGGDPSLCGGMYPLVAALFEPTAAAPAPGVDAVCNQFDIRVLVASDKDPVWADPRSWVWNRKPLAANSTMRAVACGKGVLPEAKQP
jgi:hypothetical protein